MTFALSTNWNNRRLATGEAIVEEALELGFGALELGFHTSAEQVKGFKARLDEMPVGSIHAFCPVPLSAPCWHPELYQLASSDDAARALARVHVRKNVAFAAEMGAGAVVLHAGRVPCRTLFRRNRMKKRTRLGRRLVDVFRRELDALVPVLEANKVMLGLENLPYLEGFPNEAELQALVGDWVRPWLDTGHAYVCEVNGWAAHSSSDSIIQPFDRSSSDSIIRPFDRSSSDSIIRSFDHSIISSSPLGLHVNDSCGGDDHLPPGEGKIDFAALAPIARAARHLVLEPHTGVTPEALKRGLEFLKAVWA